jgi:hypothetical protein
VGLTKCEAGSLRGVGIPFAGVEGIMTTQTTTADKFTAAQKLEADLARERREMARGRA